MSEDMKPRKFELEWKEFQGFNIWHVEGNSSHEQHEKIKVIELEPTMRLMDELAEVITSIENSYGDDMYGHGLTEALEKYNKFKDGLR